MNIVSLPRTPMKWQMFDLLFKLFEGKDVNSGAKLTTQICEDRFDWKNIYKFTEVTKHENRNKVRREIAIILFVAKKIAEGQILDRYAVVEQALLALIGHGNPWAERGMERLKAANPGGNRQSIHAAYEATVADYQRVAARLQEKASVLSGVKAESVREAYMNRDEVARMRSTDSGL